MSRDTYVAFDIKYSDHQKAYKHECPQVDTGAIGGRITFSFTPTALGEVTKATCVCGWEEDFTDYASF